VSVELGTVTALDGLITCENGWVACPSLQDQIVVPAGERPTDLEVQNATTACITHWLRASAGMREHLVAA
jgi:hypothetical protein